MGGAAALSIARPCSIHVCASLCLVSWRLPSVCPRCVQDRLAYSVVAKRRFFLPPHIVSPRVDAALGICEFGQGACECVRVSVCVCVCVRALWCACVCWDSVSAGQLGRWDPCTRRAFPPVGDAEVVDEVLRARWQGVPQEEAVRDPRLYEDLIDSAGDLGLTLIARAERDLPLVPILCGLRTALVASLGNEARDLYTEVTALEREELDAFISSLDHRTSARVAA